MFLYRSGTGAAHRVPDALSRHPPVRDQLILARTGDWAQLRAVIRGVERSINSGGFDADELPPPGTWDEALAETGHTRDSFGPEPHKLANGAVAAGPGGFGAGGPNVERKRDIEAALHGSEVVIAFDEAH